MWFFSVDQNVAFWLDNNFFIEKEKSNIANKWLISLGVKYVTEVQKQKQNKTKQNKKKQQQQQQSKENKATKQKQSNKTKTKTKNFMLPPHTYIMVPNCKHWVPYNKHLERR